MAAASEQSYSLFCGGHTHGGQVVVGWLGVFFTPVQVETPFISGTYRIGGMAVSINNGLGLTMAPLRFQAPAEVTMITVQRPDGPDSGNSRTVDAAGTFGWGLDSQSD